MLPATLSARNLTNFEFWVCRCKHQNVRILSYYLTLDFIFWTIHAISSHVKLCYYQVSLKSIQEFVREGVTKFCVIKVYSKSHKIDIFPV